MTDDGSRHEVARLKHPSKEPVQTITLPKNTKGEIFEFVLDRGKKTTKLKFREVEIYNGPLIGE